MNSDSLHSFFLNMEIDLRFVFQLRMNKYKIQFFKNDLKRFLTPKNVLDLI